MGSGRDYAPGMTDHPVDTEWNRLVMFEVLAIDFQRAHMMIQFPGLESVMHTNAFAPSYWLTMFQAMITRKFYAPGSNVRLPKIASALRACGELDDPNVEAAATKIEEEFASRYTEPFPPSEGVFEDVLYGRLLHADYDRFLISQGMSYHESHLAVFMATQPLHIAVDITLQLWQECHTKGWVTERA